MRITNATLATTYDWVPGKDEERKRREGISISERGTINARLSAEIDAKN